MEDSAPLEPKEVPPPSPTSRPNVPSASSFPTANVMQHNSGALVETAPESTNHVTLPRTSTHGPGADEVDDFIRNAMNGNTDGDRKSQDGEESEEEEEEEQTKEEEEEDVARSDMYLDSVSLKSSIPPALCPVILTHNFARVDRSSKARFRFRTPLLKIADQHQRVRLSRVWQILPGEREG